MQRSGSTAPSGRPSPLTVSALAARITESLAETFPRSVRVVGEVSSLSERTHLYFDLKDEGAVISCVMFASAARRSRFRPESGRQVVVTGRVEFYAKGGRTSLIVERVEPVGVGADEQAFQELYAQLKALGWFEPGTKKPLPVFPRRVAVVTSAAGAALQDVLDTMRRRCAAIDIAVVDVRVQGERAVADIARAVRSLSERRLGLGLDAVIVTRGGGSREDLAAFNDRLVAEAIHACELPVVAAIGHETDTTIAELVADERAATPTQAAMRLSPDRTALLEQIDAARRRLTGGMKRALHGSGQRRTWAARHLTVLQAHRVRDAVARIERAAARLAAQHPATAHARRSERLIALRARLGTLIRARVGAGRAHVAPAVPQRAIAARLEGALRALHAAQGRLAAVNPTAVLGRGFSITTRPDGTILRSAAQAVPGQTVVTRLADGRFESIVSERGAMEEGQPGTPMDLFAPSG